MRSISICWALNVCRPNRRLLPAGFSSLSDPSQQVLPSLGLVGAEDDEERGGAAIPQNDRSGVAKPGWGLAWAHRCAVHGPRSPAERGTETGE